MTGEHHPRRGQPTPDYVAQQDRPLRMLFFNEGNLGTHVLGHGQLEAALRSGLEGLPSFDARFAGLRPMGRLTLALATRRIRPLARANLDAQPLRWHLIQALRARAAIAAEVSACRPDAIQVHSHSIGLALGRLITRIPVLLSVDVTVRDWWAMPAWRPDAGWAAVEIAPSVALERRALQRAALVLGWTAWACRAVEAEAPSARVVEHHPGIDLKRFQPARRRERTLPRILFIGGRFREKGGEDLLSALSEAIGFDLEVDVVTPHQLEPRPGLRTHRLSPSAPELIDLLQQADAFCLPSHADAAPWAVLEAMACGTPVVSTRVGGIPDMLAEGRAGVLIDHGDRRALREAIQSLLANPRWAEQLAIAARRRCEERFDASLQLRRLAAMVRDLLLIRERRAEGGSGGLRR